MSRRVTGSTAKSPRNLACHILAITVSALTSPSTVTERKANKHGYNSGEDDVAAAMVCARSTGAARKWWNGVYASRFVTFAQ